MREQRLAAGQHVVVGRVKIARIPRVGDAVRMLGEIEQQRYLVVGVGLDDAHNVAVVHAVHADDMIVFGVVRFCHLHGCFAAARHAVLPQLAPRRRIDRIAELLAARGGGGDQKFLFQALLAHQPFHHKFRHRTAANIAVAHKEYFCHNSASFPLVNFTTKIFRMQVIALAKPHTLLTNPLKIRRKILRSCSAYLLKNRQLYGKIELLTH